MISVAEALGYETTSKVILHLNVVGYWDEDNQWVEGGYSPAINIRATPIPSGEKGAGTHGETLHATPTGERKPASMKFHSTTELRVNDILIYGNHSYKIIKQGDYHTGGYYAAVGMSISSFELTEGNFVLSEEDDGVVTEHGIALVAEDVIFDNMYLTVRGRKTPVKNLFRR